MKYLVDIMIFFVKKRIICINKSFSQINLEMQSSKKIFTQHISFLKKNNKILVFNKIYIYLAFQL